MQLIEIQYFKEITTNLKITDMHDLKAIYDKVKTCLKSLTKEYFVYGENSRFYPNAPKMSDLEVISLAITAECTQLDSENYLWSKIESDYPKWYEQLSHRTRFNKRRKQLCELINNCMNSISDFLCTALNEDTLIIDSMPITICHLAREKRSTICRKPNKDQVIANKGFNASLKSYFIGYKLHLITTSTGIYRDLLITPASTPDNIFLKILNVDDTHLKGFTILGDKGYVGKQLELDLKDKLDISMSIPYRKNQKDFTKYPFHLKLKRKTIETVFSQYVDEFMIKRNYAKSYDGLEIRLYTKIAAKTFKQYWNYINGKSINRTKHSLAA